MDIIDHVHASSMTYAYNSEVFLFQYFFESSCDSEYIYQIYARGYSLLNGRGWIWDVIINRQWTIIFFFLKDYDPYEENPGTGPFSEPETQIMRKLSQSFDPHVWVNVHSGMEVGHFLLGASLIWYSTLHN